MLTPLDDIHYDYREIDGYNKTYNFVVSPREPGKTSMMWVKKIYKPWVQDERPWIYFVRQTVEITEALISSICLTTVNKFCDESVNFEYKLGTFKDGVVDVFIKGKLFFRIVSLSIPLRRIKLAVVPKVKGVFMDEYIIDIRTGERYIANEAFKIKEAYTTWRRENPALKFYFVGNPYSLSNPLFADWGVDTNKLKIGSFYVGNTYVIHMATLNPKLVEKLLKENPLYKFDDSYTRYALYGEAINDQNIIINQKLPEGFHIKYVVRYANKNIGVYVANNPEEVECKYHCRYIDFELSKRREIFCFDFSNLVQGAVLLSISDRVKLSDLKSAMARRRISFENVDIYYYFEDIYKYL